MLYLLYLSFCFFRADMKKNLQHIHTVRLQKQSLGNGTTKKEFPPSDFSIQWITCSYFTWGFHVISLNWCRNSCLRFPSNECEAWHRAFFFAFIYNGGIKHLNTNGIENVIKYQQKYDLWLKWKEMQKLKINLNLTSSSSSKPWIKLFPETFYKLQSHNSFPLFKLSFSFIFKSQAMR